MNVEGLLANLGSLGWKPGLTEESYDLICGLGLRSDSPVLAAIACDIALECKPITLRGLFYRIVSAGVFPGTDKKYYDRVGRLVTRLRRRGVIKYNWIIDSMRSTAKPSSWSGLEDYADTVRDSYRRDFWRDLPDYVHVFCEKDAIAGTISPVTNKFDVALSPIRGYASESYAYEIGNQWATIDKPIHAYYLGDYDPSGFDIERDIREKIAAFSKKDFEWERLAVNEPDFDGQQLIPLKPKQTDKRYQKFIVEHGERCAEVDAINPNELRARVTEAIERWIPQDEWERLQLVESLERETFQTAFNEALERGGGDSLNYIK